ncbi:hypothetical protein CN345_20685 [Bacillus thuringiensis]|uniref:hypothetical protein n=1 Tax=Bacillus thuringiensis TaxID=1428 RepID=UPI000BF2C45E|nr:hypothetical protein [Bacillus thuringiensis]PEZ28648.1 hypothetical protein CN345_20685 [Bacillus thuringiensis]
MKNLKNWDEICEKAFKLKKTGIPHRTVAKQLTCDPSDLRKQLKKRGLFAKTYSKWDDLYKQIILLQKQGLSNREIAKQFNIKEQSLYQQLKKRGTPSNIQEKNQNKWDQICKEVVNMRKQGLTKREIAKQLKLNEGTLYTQLKKRGLWDGESNEEIRKKWDNLCEKAINLQEQNINHSQIAKQLNCDGGNLYKQLKKRELKINKIEKNTI